MAHPITEAIIAETNDKINEPYSTTRKIKGFFRNKFRSGTRELFGGSSNNTDRAKAFGTNLIRAVPKLLAFGASQIPIVGSFAEAIAEKGGELAAEKVMDKLSEARMKDLQARQMAGSMTVGEMTELMQRQGDAVVSPDSITKLKDAIRKVDEAWTQARRSIMAANDCETVYRAAKDYAYLKYRIVRMHYYVESLRSWLDRIDEVTERYSAQVIGFQYDLIDGMDNFFEKAGAEYHTQNCKNEKHCYFKQHGIA